MEPYKQRKRKLSGRKRAQWFTVQAPSPEKEVEETPVLELKAFSKPTHINFDRVKVGASKTLSLFVTNSLDVSQCVNVLKFPFEKGFSINKQEFSVPPSGVCTVEITWTPPKSVSCRETVLFKSSTGLKMQAYLHGIASSPKKKKKNGVNKKIPQMDQSDKQTAVLNTKESSNFMDDKKENAINPLFESFSGGSSVQCFFPTPQSKLSINPIEILSDSPIRRQTYTINCMLRESRIGAEIKTLPRFSLANQSKNELVLKEINTETNFNFDSMPSHSNLWSKKTAINKIIEDDKSGKDILNDSLEIQSSDLFVSNDVSAVHACFPNSLTNVFNSMVDDVQVFDLSAKHRYFGYTPDRSNNKHVLNTGSDTFFKFENSNVEIDSFNLVKEPTSQSTFLLNCQNSKTRMLSNITSPEKRLTFTSDFAKTYTTIPHSNCIKESQEIPVKAFPEMNTSLVKPSLPVNEENFNDSLCDLSPCPEMKSDIIEEFKCPEPLSLPCSYSNESLTEPFQPPHASQMTSNLSQLDDVKESHSSIAFEIKTEDIPNPFKIPRNNRSIFTAKQKQQTKFKQHITKKKPIKTVIRNLKLTTSKESFDESLAEKGKKITAQDSANCSSSNNIRKKPVRSLSQRLTITKHKGYEMYQPNPYASFNAYYDEYWMEKQEDAFTNWLNFILTPNDDFRSSEEVQVNSAEIWVESMKDASTVRAPSKEDLSFKTYTAAKQLNRLRKSACLLYQTDKLAGVIKKIEMEVDIKKISVRKDRAMHADLGIKKDLMNMLLSYNPLWLRIGLETVYGEMIILHSNRDVVGLSRFIIHRFLSNPDIVTKYSYSSIRNYYKPGYDDDMKRFILKKFLLLVFFLDVAKRAHLIDHNPCLFSKSSKYKCSRDLLLTFSREYLSGEGDITKHLRYLGCVVLHEQAPIEEFDYAVRNIAMDLRCGLRLGRVVELLLQDWTISKLLRVNTLNRLAKIHNNGVILKALEAASINIEGNIDARDIVDGNREKTLSLLWQIIFKTQISKNVNLEILKKENSYLRRSLKLNADFAAFEALLNGDCETKELETSFFNSKLYKENEVIQQLLQWCQNVAAHYGVKVYNFTSSFSDGRVLCFLLHHYHPNLLPRDKIKMDTSGSYFLKQMEASEDENSPVTPGSKELTYGLKDKLMKNEKENLDLISKKFQEIGQIPILSFPLHIPNTIPDEKVIITLVSYINIRLMELSVEIRAARTILLAYRKWCLRKKQQKLKTQIAAACIIQRYWRNYTACKRKHKEEQAAAIIQRSWKRFTAVNKLKQLKHEKHLSFVNQKATVIQAAFKGYLVRKHRLKCQIASITLQKNIRMWIARNYYRKVKKIIVTIQNTYRAKVLGHSQRQKYLQLKILTTRFQACVRGQLVRNEIRKRHAAAVVIQSQFRGFLQKQKFEKEKAACLKIQSSFRGFICRKLFLKQKKAIKILQVHFRATLEGKRVRESYLKVKKQVITIQAFVRGWLVRNHMHKIQSAANTIQSAYRSFACRKRYLHKKQCVVILQRRIRSYLQIKANERRISRAAILIQSVFRSYIAKKKFLKVKAACVTIQAHLRRHIIQKQFCKQKHAAILLQSHFKAYLTGKKIRESYLKNRKCIIAIQALVRGMLVRKHILKINCSAVKIQSTYRTFVQRQYYLKLKKAAITLQRYTRSYLRKKAIERERMAAAVMIQSYFRCYIARKKFLKLKSATLLLQSCLRRHVIRRNFLKQKSASVVIQRYFKATMLARQTRETYLQLRKCIVSIQTHIRGWLVRKHLKKMNKSAIRIQSNYRSHICRKNFCQLKQSAIILQRAVRIYLNKRAVERKRNAAAVIIQSAIRGFRERIMFRRKKAACIVIQSQLRKQICRKQFLKVKRATTVIQNHYRAFRVGCEVRNCYMKDRKSIVTVQAVIKGWLTRRHAQKLHRSATTIQAVYRSYICWKSYVKQKQSAIVLQRCIRSYLCKKAIERKQFAAAVVIQSNFRGYLQRLNFVREKSACIVIQSHLRKLILRKQFLKQKKAATAIQSYYRAYKLSVETRRYYLKSRKDIITTQAVARGWLTRRNVQKLHKSAMAIQATYRSYICKKTYLKKKQSAIILQRCIKSFLIKRATDRRRFAAAVVLQSNFRGFIKRSQFKREKTACIVIQSYLRRYICRKRYLKQKEAATAIQSYYRAYKLSAATRRCYLKSKKDIITAQAVARGWLTRRNAQKLHKSAMTIQAKYRSYICKKTYLKKKQSTIILQRCIRSFLIKRATDKRRFAAAVVIQSNFRGFIERSQFKRQKTACIVIQSYLRRHVCRKQYLKQKEAATTIQIFYKALKIGSKVRSCYVKDRKRIITVQAVIKGWLIRRRMQKCQESATLLQAAYRCYIFRKRYLKQKQSAIILQKCIRSYLCKKAIERKRFAAAVVIQSNFRGYVKRSKFMKEKSACIDIQSYFRRYICRKKFLTKKKAVIKIQNCFRARQLGRSVRQSYLNDRKSVVSVQAIARGWLTRRHLRKLHCSATKIQTVYRSFICKKRYHQQKNSAIILQKCMKSYLNRKAFERKQTAAATVIQAAFRSYIKRSEFKKKKAACIVIQSHFRRHIYQKQYFKQKLAASIIQRTFKAMLLGRMARITYLNYRKCVTTAQATVRGWLVRKRMQKLHCSAVKIQTTYRAYICKKQYLKKKQSAIVIQRHFKAYMCGKRVYSQYLTLRQSTILIQTVWRNYKAQREESRRHDSATLLQSHIRKLLAQKKYLKMKRSAIVIQRYYLAYKAGLKEYCSYREKVKSCLKIQACFRGYMVRKTIKEQVDAAILIQRTYRCWKERKALAEVLKKDPQYMWYLQLRSCVILFQRQARFYLQKRTQSAVLIQSYIRMWLIRKRYKERKAALKIQALWRGYSVRRSITNEKILAIRKNVTKVSHQNNQLKHRTAKALKGLEGTDLREILHSLKTLDVSTRLSPTCCERLQQSNGVFKLIALISSCNRSVPHQEIIKYSTNILLNLAKYEKTVDSVWTEEALEVILELMRIYRDKPVPIFSKCCSLFWIFNQDPKKAMILKENTIFMKQVKAFHTLWLRKKTLESDRSGKSTIRNKTKNNSSRESLHIDPEWMLGRHRRREFEDPFIAISSLVHSLDSTSGVQ